METPLFYCHAKDCQEHSLPNLICVECGKTKLNLAFFIQRNGICSQCFNSKRSYNEVILQAIEHEEEKRRQSWHEIEKLKRLFKN